MDEPFPSISSLYLASAGVYFMVYTLVLILYFELDKKRDFPNSYEDYLKYVVVKWMLLLLPLLVGNLTRQGVSKLLNYELNGYSGYYNETTLQEIREKINEKLLEQLGNLNKLLSVFILLMYIIAILRLYNALKNEERGDVYTLLFIFPLVISLCFSFTKASLSLPLQVWIYIPIVLFIYWSLLGLYFRRLGLFEPIL